MDLSRRVVTAGLAAARQVSGGNKRGFITLPSFGSFVPAGKKYSDAQVFPYTKEQVFDVVADVDRYSEFVPMCMGSRVIRGKQHSEQHSEQGVVEEAVDAELVVGYPPFSERYMSRVVIERPWRITATAKANGGIFKHMKTVWEFAEAADKAGRVCPGKGTLVRFGIEYEFVSILHAQAASLVFEKMAKTNLEAYLGRCKRLYDK
ncbi:Coenzyme Q-binding protein coq10a, mitochondrial [Coemansia sp. RSA 1933]|nr:Coenzyme Q-binding protein coq10a, mitochondrial [Coemansia sp. RSA 1933]